MNSNRPVKIAIAFLAIAIIAGAYFTGRSDERNGTNTLLETVATTASAAVTSPTGTIEDRDVYYPGSEAIGDDRIGNVE